MVSKQIPEKTAIPDGIFKKMGAKSFCGRETRHGQGLGALNLSLLGGIKKDESGKTPGGHQTGGIDFHKYS